MNTPFHDKNGKLAFPFEATQSIAFIFPVPPPETLGKEIKFILPEEFRQDHQKNFGILLSIGPGYYDKKNKWCPVSPELKPGVRVCFDTTVPNSLLTKGLDGKDYEISICVEADIYGLAEKD
jgi:hypothetical protein